MRQVSRVRRYHGPLAAAVGLALVVAGAAFVLAGHGAAFVGAVRGVSRWTLVLAVGLHVVAVVARSEAWAVSVRAAGARLGRRCCYQFASLGFAANVIAPSLGTAVRISALRRFKRAQAPAVPALVAAEVPVLAVQAVLCAAMSFALVGRLGAPWWAPAAAVGATGAVLAALPRVARRHADGFWRGLGALGCRADRARVAGCVVLVVGCDLGRSLLLLHAAGLPASVVDAMALRLATGVLAALPLGLGSTAGAALLIFGAGGVGDLAARARPARPARAADLAAVACCACLTLGFVAAAAR
jgi:uncharacterized membrane protein YbhN (UPF0104 family)